MLIKSMKSEFLLTQYFYWHEFSFFPTIFTSLTLTLSHSFFLRQLSSSVWWNPWWQWSLSFFRPLGNTKMETSSMFPQQLTHCHSQHRHLPEQAFLVLWLVVLCHNAADTDWVFVMSNHFNQKIYLEVSLAFCVITIARSFLCASLPQCGQRLPVRDHYLQHLRQSVALRSLPLLLCHTWTARPIQPRAQVLHGQVSHLSLLLAR